ncbi:LysM peptidoglycan-binding domain-containing protein [Pontibacter sp. 172403-2]|uniref:LysM peptidoglycan-binding domain-containing protein n=1 Tax=Pontibacter rufus TaxID=2791028 RepID=UPI0018AFEF1D|nr:LysM peptidoglycan-binding domain-containing protein [Pontibacter sp. 172403-2]MBF9251801.1 LysM peptidoglycan-binding domain-containing protein [Pontibacter sp. 172403-2]
MGLFDFLKKGKEAPAHKANSNILPKEDIPKPAGAPPVSKGTGSVSRTPGHPEQGFYSEQDKQKITDPGPDNDVYTVQSGDSLSKIAQKLYGDANSWHKLYEANKDKIGDNPDLIRPGQRLTVPRS